MPSLSLRSVAATLMLVVGGRAATAQKYLLVVNPRNPVARLDAAQVSRIYLGKLQAWNINGDLQPVAPVDQPADSRVA